MILALYTALAILVGLAYGARGLALLSFFYFSAGAWLAFMLVWGRAARAAGRWNFERVERAGMREDDRDPGPPAGETRRAEPVTSPGVAAVGRRQEHQPLAL